MALALKLGDDLVDGLPKIPASSAISAPVISSAARPYGFQILVRCLAGFSSPPLPCVVPTSFVITVLTDFAGVLDSQASENPSRLIVC